MARTSLHPSDQPPTTGGTQADTTGTPPPPGAAFPLDPRPDPIYDHEGIDRTNDDLTPIPGAPGGPWENPGGPWPQLEVPPGTMLRGPLSQQPADMPLDGGAPPPAPPARDDWRTEQPTPDPVYGPPIEEAGPEVPSIQITQGGEPTPGGQWVGPVETRPREPQPEPRVAEQAMPGGLIPVWNAAHTAIVEYIQPAAEAIKETATAVGEAAASAPGRFYEDVAAPIVRRIAPRTGLVEGVSQLAERDFKPAPPRIPAEAGFVESVRATVEPIIAPVAGAITGATTAVEQTVGAPPGSLRQAAEDVSNTFPVGPAVGMIRRGGGMADDAGRAARPTVEVIQERLGAARQAVQQARAAGDIAAERAASDQMWALTDQLADAMNARRAVEPAIASDVGRRVEDLPLPEETADDLVQATRAQERVQGAPADLSGPVSVPPNMAGRMNAAVPFDPASAAAGAGAGAMAEDEEGEQADPLRTAAGMFIGALAGTPQGRALARKLARQAQNMKPPNALEIAQSYRHSVGMLGQPATGLMNAIGGPVSAGSALATDVVRTGLMKGYPVPAIFEAGSLVAGLGEATRDALGTALGFIPQRVRNAPDFRPPLAERMQGPVGKALGLAIDTPGRLATQTPDAFFGALFDRLGRRRAANELMTDSGVSRLDPVAQVQEINRLLSNPTADEALQIEARARAFSEEMTYKGPAGYWEEVLGSPFRAKGGPTTANSPAAAQIHDLVGSFLMPFYSSIFKIHKLAATYTPGLGFVADTSKPMSERVARQLVGLSFGLWVADRAAQELVTGPGPEDPDEQARWRATGKEPWSTFVPGVGYVKSDNFAQAAPFLKTIGGWYDAKRYAKPGAAEQDGLKEGDRIARQVMRAFEDFPVVNAVKALVAVAESPVNGLADLGINAASSLVPAIVRSNEASKDPYQRTVDRNAPVAEQIRQKAANRLGKFPGVGGRQDSPPAIDRRGEPIPNPRAGAAAFLPAARQVQPEDPITAEMGQYGVDLDKARDRFAFTRAGADSPEGAPGSVRVMLTPDQQQQWARYRWQKIQEAAPTVQADPRYAAANEGARRRVWENVVKSAEAYADRALKADIGRPALEEKIRTAPSAEPPVRKAS